MKILVDGRELHFEGRPTLLELAQQNGLFIPSLCDHPGLEPFAACRLCLVEVKGRRGFVPACSTAAEEGMEVRTSSPELLGLRRGILELILSEHPHACLICAEKGACDDYKSTIRKTGEVTGCVLCSANGRCRLQRVVEMIGVSVVPFPSLRREGEVRRDDPFIDRDNSLCILCGRCVRVCDEVRGASVLTFVSRGSSTVIGAALDRRLVESGCQFCGACVDVCPTGSLAERAVRYSPLVESEKKTVCPFCGQGCVLSVGLRGGSVQAAAPDPDGPVNRGQACVRGRFLVKPAITHPRRLLRPLVRKDGALREASWDEALSLAAARLSGFSPGEIEVVVSAQSPCEDLFVLNRLSAEVLRARVGDGLFARSAGAGLRSLARAAGQGVSLNFRMAEIALAERIVVIGEDLPVCQPIVGLEVRRARSRGAEVIFAPAGMKTREIDRVSGVDKPSLFLFGPDFVNGPEGLAPLAALWTQAARSGGRLLALDREANLRGRLEIAEAFAAESGPGIPRALYLAGPSPKLKPGEAELVIVQGSYSDDNLEAADVVLPEATSLEAEGTLVNVEGRIQVTAPALEPPGEARPGWWIAAALAAKLGAPGFVFESAAAVRAALVAAVPAFGSLSSPSLPEDGVFLVEKAAGEAAPIDLATVKDLAAGRGRGASPDPDTYKGLNLARENKGLKLIRGRR